MKEETKSKVEKEKMVLEKKDETAFHPVETIIRSPQDVISIASFTAKSGMFPQFKTMAQQAVVIEVGRELRLQPGMALETIHWIDEKKLAIESKVLAANALAVGIRWKIHKKTPKECKIEFYKPGSDIPNHTETFTWEDAVRARLADKKNFQTYPEEMLYWRCFAKGIRVFDPRVCLGFYIKEEAMYFDEGDFRDEVEIVREKPKVIAEKEEDYEDAEEVEEELAPWEQHPDDFKSTREPGEDNGKVSAEDKKAAAYARIREQRIKVIKSYLTAMSLDVSDFKKFLAEKQKNRSFVGKNEYGNWSFHCGKDEDLEHLEGRINDYIKVYAEERMSKMKPGTRFGPWTVPRGED